MTTFKKKKFITSAHQTKAIREARIDVTKEIDDYMASSVSTKPTKEQVFEDSNKPDLEEMGRQAKAVAEKEHAYLMQQQATHNPQLAKDAGAGLAGGLLTFHPFPPAPYREPKWLLTGEAAKHIKVSPTKFIKLRAEGIKFYKLNDGTILYNVHDLNDWVMSHVV